MNARQYHESTSSAVFSEVYATIASQIVRKTGVVHGNAIDLGGGPGMLGMALAEITRLHVTVYDMLDDCITIARENIAARGLEARMCARQGCAEALMFDDNAIDLVASRGSIFFWNDQAKGLAEVYRVLKPGGWAYIGGGFGSEELLRKVELLRAGNPEWNEKRKERMRKCPPSHYEELLRNLSIKGVVDHSEAGTWLMFRK